MAGRAGIADEHQVAAIRTPILQFVGGLGIARQQRLLTARAIRIAGDDGRVEQAYALAADQFRALLDRYPANDKAPGALLKLGLSQSGLRQTEAAMATLRQVGQRYPGTDAARIAEDRLRSMQVAGSR